MSHWNRILHSSVFKKYVMAITGLMLVLFVIAHLAGNLLLFQSPGDSFNLYAERLQSFGFLFYLAEAGLVVLFLVHIVTGIGIKKSNAVARPARYNVYKSKGGPSHANISSLYMPITGGLILVFLLLHIWQFRLGPSIDQGYVVEIGGQKMRDLYRLVIETFKNPIFVTIYAFCMIVLGIHIRHGFWSLFQSLGLKNQRIHFFLVRISPFVAGLIALGFLSIPVWIYFNA